LSLSESYGGGVSHRAARKSTQRECSTCDVNVRDAQDDVISVAGQSAADYVMAGQI